MRYADKDERDARQQIEDVGASIEQDSENPFRYYVTHPSIPGVRAVFWSRGWHLHVEVWDPSTSTFFAVRHNSSYLTSVTMRSWAMRSALWALFSWQTAVEDTFEELMRNAHHSAKMAAETEERARLVARLLGPKEESNPEDHYDDVYLSRSTGEALESIRNMAIGLHALKGHFPGYVRDTLEGIAKTASAALSRSEFEHTKAILERNGI